MLKRSVVQWWVVFFLMAWAGTVAAQAPNQPVAADKTTPAFEETGEPDQVAEASDASDPDLPPIARGKISKRDYLKRRGEQVGMLRGLPNATAAEMRNKAIHEAERQMFSRPIELATSAWTWIGPAPLPNGQTTAVSTAVSGRVTCIAIKPTDPNVVYVGTAQGGLYRTLDGGTTWVQLMDSAQSLAIGALAIAPSQPNTVYVGTGEPNSSCDSFFGVGLYRIDNAESTADLTGPINPLVTTGIAGTTAFTGRSISKILVHPTDPATIFVSTASGIGGSGCSGLTSAVPPLALRGLYRSTNATAALGSITFAKITVTSAGSVPPDTSGNRSIYDMVMEPGVPSTLVVDIYGLSTGTDGGIYRTTNALAATPTFTKTLTLGTTTGGYRANFAINKVSSTVTVLCAAGDGTGGTLRKSLDGGTTWGTAITSLGATGVGFCDGQCWYDIAVDMDPGNANVIYLGGSANGTNSSLLVKSTNGGTSFSRIDTGLHADNHAINVAPSDANTVYTGNDGGIWKSTNAGTSWTSLNNTLFSATQFQSLALHPTDRWFMIGGTQDNGTEWKKPDNSWTRADYGDGGFALIDQNAANTTNVTMYHTYYNQVGSLMGFARVTSTASASDGGWSFLGCNGTSGNGINCSDTAVLFYAPMALGPGSPNTVYFGTDRLYRSANSGTNHSVVSQAPIASGIPITAIGISPQNDSVRIVGLQNGQVWATTTGSSTLTNVTSASFPTNPASTTSRYVGRAIIDPNNVNTAYVTFSFYATAGQGVWKTTNLNNASPTWTAAGNGIPSIPINAFVVDPANSSRLFAGTDIGVYASTNGGTTWSPFGTGFPVVSVFDMAINAPNRILRVATHGRGIYEISICTGVAVTPGTLASGCVGGAYSQSFASSGGTSPYTYSVSAGSLPPGLTLSAAGTLSGTPTSAGAYAFTVSSSDSGTCSGGQSYNLSITQPQETAPGSSPSTIQSWSNKTTQAWPSNPDATAYRLYRGTLADLPNLLTATTNACLKYSGSALNTNTITEDPAAVAGRFYWYLVVGTNGSCFGSAGNGTAGSRRINSSAGCP